MHYSDRPSLSSPQPTIFGTLTNERPLFDNRLVSHLCMNSFIYLLINDDAHKQGHLGFQAVRLNTILIEKQKVMGILINVKFLRIKIPKSSNRCLCRCVCVCVFYCCESLPSKYVGVFVHINKFFK